MIRSHSKTSIRAASGSFSARRRRGSIYVAVLGASMLVTVIGISALLSVRVQRRTNKASADAAQARISAESVMDLALLRIANDPDWRTTYAGGGWTPQETAGDVTYTFKIVDEADGDLANDPDQPARLHVKAVVADAVRLCSVLLRPQPGVSGDLLTNSGMEEGTAGWTGLGNCDLEWYTDEPHGGTGYIWVKNRNSIDQGASQYVTTKIVNGADYYTEVWVKMKDTSETVRVSIAMDTTNGPFKTFLLATNVGTTWTKIAGTVTPTWSGTLNAAYWKVETNSTTQEFKIDDALLIRGTSLPATIMVPQAGSRRREVTP